jgi:hypothetical protein
MSTRQSTLSPITETFWESTRLPATNRKPLYRLYASLHGFVLESTVFSHGAKGYACATLLDGVHVPDSPSGKIGNMEEAARRAKAAFAHWTLEILRRV